MIQSCSRNCLCSTHTYYALIILIFLGQMTSRAKQWLCPKVFLGHQSWLSLCTELSRNSRASRALLAIPEAALNQWWKFIEETALFPCPSVEITMVHILYRRPKISNRTESYMLILFLTHCMTQITRSWLVFYHNVYVNLSWSGMFVDKYLHIRSTVVPVFSRGGGISPLLILLSPPFLTQLSSQKNCKGRERKRWSALSQKG